MTFQLHWTAGLHHDGSAQYVSNLIPKLGDTVTIRLRAPVDAPIRSVFLRTAPDGENNHTAKMQIVERDDLVAWWQAELPVYMPRNAYRFKILTGEGAYYLNQMGVSRSDGPDWYDFKILADYAAPAWLADSVFYQIFPDRFFNGNPANDVPPGAWTRRGFSTQQRAWGERPLPYRESGNLDFFGGDLEGIAQKLDYLRDLGVSALYLTPIFVSRTNHRYDIADFSNIDPHLGGNEALSALRRALDAAGMRIVLDVTLNHCGWYHPWFTEAQADINAPTAKYFTFNKHPDDYESWLGVKSLPKLNYRSEKLRDVLYRDPESVLRRWLREPYRIDGWRLDVANMQGRQGAVQLGNKVGRQLRRAVKADNPQAYIVGENFYDGTPHLQGDELDAVMNYQGFILPLRRWLAGYDLGIEWDREDADTTLLPSEALSAQWMNFRTPLPWVIARQQFNLLSSHDIARVLNVVKGDKSLVRLGAALLLTYLGVPCVYYGDEVGLEGGPDPDNRRCMPWETSQWDNSLRDHFRRLIHLRRTAPALIEGGYQQLYALGGLFVFQRQSARQRLIVVAYRGPGDLARATIPVRQAALRDGAQLADLLSGKTFTVRDGALQIEGLVKGDALVLEEN